MESFTARVRHKALLIWDLIDPSPLGFYRRASRPVDGWLTRSEEAALFRMAREVPRGQCIVELGSWFGRSAILLGGGSVRGSGAPVYAVDLFTAAGFAKEVLEQRAGDAARDFMDRFQMNMGRAGLQKQVTAMRSTTAALGESWSGPRIGFLFIDADHSYDGVRSDWLSWKSRLAAGARVAFHDYHNPSFEGVTRFVDELIESKALRSVERHDSILCGEVADGQPSG
jgi:predicted O-methyltransferase YrrM